MDFFQKDYSICYLSATYQSECVDCDGECLPTREYLFGSPGKRRRLFSVKTWVAHHLALWGYDPASNLGHWHHFCTKITWSFFGGVFCSSIEHVEGSKSFEHEFSQILWEENCDWKSFSSDPGTSQGCHTENSERRNGFTFLVKIPK